MTGVITRRDREAGRVTDELGFDGKRRGWLCRSPGAPADDPPFDEWDVPDSARRAIGRSPDAHVCAPRQTFWQDAAEPARDASRVAATKLTRLTACGHTYSSAPTAPTRARLVSNLSQRIPR